MYLADTTTAPQAELKDEVAQVPSLNLTTQHSAPTQATGDIEAIVRAAANKYGISEDYFVSVARCESTLNPTAVNHNYYAGGGNPSGLFQYLPETWSRISSRAGVSGDVFDATINAEVTGWAFANGYSNEWACA